MDLNEEQLEFIKSYDFMRVGQAISQGRWQSAVMTVRRMESRARELALPDFERGLAGLRQAVLRKDTAQAKQALAGIVARRVQLLKRYVYTE